MQRSDLPFYIVTRIDHRLTYRVWSSIWDIVALVHWLKRVVSDGLYNFKDQIYLYSLNHKGKPGYDVITPFETAGKEIVLVNRGWIPGELKELPEINSTQSSTKVTGLLRKIYKANIFKPNNDIKGNIWFSVNLDDMEKFTGKKFSNFIIYLEDLDVKAPLPRKITVDVPNNHLKYAITWYSIAISILLYYLYFRKKKWIILALEINP